MEIHYENADTALGLVKSGDRVFVHGSAATPRFLLNKLLAKAGIIKNIELTCISTYGEIEWNRPKVINNGFFINSLFVSSNVREWVNGRNGNYVPVFLSEIPALFEEGLLRLDVAMVQVSPPDRHGYCTLGTSVDAALCATRMAPVVIAQVNPQMPRVMGDGIIHYSEFTAMVWEDSPLPEIDYSLEVDETAIKIGKNVASLIEDEATLQMGIGTIPDAVLQQLSGHKDLGVHTEMFSDGLVPLVEKGVITNEYKKVQPGRIVTSFILGTRKVYDFVNDNPFVNCMNVAFVNDSDVIRRNPKVVAINSAIEIDLTGQICADSIGTFQYSGIGGQMDFMRGASLSEGGKPIIAMPSITRTGISRIVPFLKPGAGVVTTRGHVHYIATEFGIVNLYGRNMEQRARLLISIAHPDHRAVLEQAYYERFRKLYAEVK
ncbi:acetyl-CoA hydrolase/transferase family protein [Niabella beijingensis]|uniref:acetyl-CoA hydrolase/transferase family protein n=1 Tax=Niabella beijingensis TaxID=2872700 RepID=UPI001CBC7684|nr:acetyl-CoA hydrolase/transferase C-terminal domain-containing protein [Niabella beijingensis]MBZ4191626.1 4-hydroxybutyrate CoA-transferase [Niabella beijingensis]